MVGTTPLHNAPHPSSRTMTVAVCAALVYLDLPDSNGCNLCDCMRILHTSAGVTTSTASVRPDASPAKKFTDLGYCCCVDDGADDWEEA